MHDKNGRDWAKLSLLKRGDKVETDESFHCVAVPISTVYEDENGLFICCNQGKHYLDGQLNYEDNDSLTGIYKHKAEMGQ